MIFALICFGAWDPLALAWDRSGAPVTVQQDERRYVLARGDLRTEIPLFPGGLAVDHHDDVIVAGFGVQTPLSTLTVAKITRNGAVAWSRLVPLPSALAQAHVATDASGAIFVALMLEEHELAIAMLEPNGRLRWLERYATPSLQTLSALFVGAHGELSVSGSIRTVRRESAFVVHVSGEQAWLQIICRNGDPHRLTAIDGDFAAGFTLGIATAGALRLDHETGEVRWRWRHAEHGRAVVAESINAAGDVVLVSGAIYAGAGKPDEIFVAALDRDTGTERWLKREPLRSHARPHVLRVTKSGHVDYATETGLETARFSIAQFPAN